MRRKREVVEGHVYRRLGSGGGTWEVVAIRKDGMGAMHAQLRRVDSPKTLKTLAVGTLLDPYEFELQADTGQNGG
jgi:hypothetical protein